MGHLALPQRHVEVVREQVPRRVPLPTGPERSPHAARAEDTHGALLVGDAANPETTRRLCPWLRLPALASRALTVHGCILDFGRTPNCRGGHRERDLISDMDEIPFRIPFDEVGLLTRLHSAGDVDELALFGSGLLLTK